MVEEWELQVEKSGIRLAGLCSVFVLSLFFSSTCFAVSPGGVSVDLDAWYKADGAVYNTGTDQADDGETVATWDDAAGTNDATQETAANKPTFESDEINGYPIVSFDSSNDFLSFSTASVKNSSYTLYAVGLRTDSSSSYAVGSPGGTANQDLHFGYSTNTQVRFGQWTNDLNVTVSAHNSPALTPFLLFGEFDSSVGHSVTEFRNGLKTEASNTNTVVLSGDKAGYLGRVSSNYYGGDLAEVVMYSRALSDSDEEKVQSYLALKYGISLKGLQDYVDSSGITIFSGTSTYSGHNNDIAGIGSDTESDLHQSSSQSQNSDAVLSISDPSSLSAGDFLLWGNNDGSLSLSKTDVPSLVSSRLQRVWRFHETGSVGTVTLSFDFSGMDVLNTGEEGDYALLISDSSTFVDSVRTDTAAFSGDVLSFSGVDIDSGDYVTFGVKKGKTISLGGVLTNVKLWLDASDPDVLHTDAACTSAVPSSNSRVKCWEDKSGNDAHVTVPTGDCIEALSGTQTCNPPTYLINQFNGRPALSFSRSNNENLRYDLTANGDDWTGNSFSVFLAFEQIGTPSTYYSFFSNGTPPGSDHFQIDVIEDGGTRRFRVNGLTSGTAPTFDSVDNILKLYAVRATTSLVELYSDGDQQNESLTSTVRGRIFQHYRINQNRNGNQMNNSKIGEVILYDTNLSNCEMAVVNQYLGNKYGRDFGGGIPGGVECESVYLWYDANEGVTHSSNSVSAWEDRGQYRVDATQSTSSAQPTLSSSLLNNNPGIVFDGSDSLTFDATNAPSVALARSYYIVAKPNSGAADGSLLSHGTDSDGQKVSLGATPTQVSADVGGHVYGFTRSLTTDVELLTFELEDGDDSDEWEMRVNGDDMTESTLSGSAQTMNTGTTSAAIGAEAFSSDRYDGSIGEMFVYGDVLSSAGRNQIESYLAILYGITLDAENDYIDSTGAVLYESSDDDDEHVTNIAGIGHDDAQSLLQTTSRSQASDSIVSVSIDDEDTMESGEFLLWGNDGGAASETSSNTPASVETRLTRIWKFRETGEVGDVDVSFDLTGLTVSGTQASDFFLIRDSNAFFSSGATVTTASGFSDDVVTFADVDIEDGEHVALGTGTGTLSVSILDSSDDELDDPPVTFGESDLSSNTQIIEGTLGSSSQKISITNGTGASSWNLNIAAENTTSMWTDGTNSFDFNDTVADGDDADSVGGTLTIDPSTLSVTARSGCDVDGLTKGSSGTFVEGSTDSVTLLSADSTADIDCIWDITGISLTQEVPASQLAGDYVLTMVLSMVTQ